MMPGLALAAATYIALNEVRYHTALDIGLSHIPHVDGPYWSFKFVPFNLKTLTYLGPKFDDVFPYMHPTFLGQGLLLTSPAFLLALRGKNWLMGLCAALVALPMLFVWANGYSQFGCRHFVPMFAFLLVLMAERELKTPGKALIILSIMLVTFGVWSVHEWGLTTPW